jgi:hypothetical protein
MGSVRLGLEGLVMLLSASDARQCNHHCSHIPRSCLEEISPPGNNTQWQRATTRINLQELIWGGAEMLSVLRLMVLLSATHGGVPKKHWDGLRMEFVSAYGHQHLLTLHSLEKAGEGRLGRPPCRVLVSAPRVWVTHMCPQILQNKTLNPCPEMPPNPPSSLKASSASPRAAAASPPA